MGDHVTLVLWTQRRLVEENTGHSTHSFMNRKPTAGCTAEVPADAFKTRHLRPCV